MRGVRLFVAACVAGLTMLTALPAGAVDPPGDWTRHVDQPWTWYAPNGWIGAAGSDDVNIQLYRTRWRERVTFAGVRPNGKRVKGEMVTDYSVSVYGDSGAESFQIRSAPRRTFDDVVGQLRLVQSLIFYCGSVC